MLHPFVTTFVCPLTELPCGKIQSTQPFLLPCVGVSAYLAGGGEGRVPGSLLIWKQSGPPLLSLKEALANTHLWRLS